MYNVLTLNKIAKCGTDILGDNYTVSDNETNPVAVLVRSASMHEMHPVLMLMQLRNLLLQVC